MMPFEKRGEQSQAALFIYRVLFVVFSVLLLVFITGSIYGLLKKGKNPQTAAAAGEESENESIFSGLGTIRVSTADEEAQSLIVGIVFPYNSADRAFSEELVSRIGDLKKITVDYLGSLRSEELQEMELINSELLNRYNAILRLGQIKELRFLEFIWL